MSQTRWSYSKLVAAASKNFKRMQNNRIYCILMFLTGIFTVIPTLIIHAKRSSGQSKQKNNSFAVFCR